jgi:hypothetical protein
MNTDPRNAPCNLRRFPLPVAKLQPVMVPLPSWRWALRWIGIGAVAFFAFTAAFVGLLLLFWP